MKKSLTCVVLLLLSITMNAKPKKAQKNKAPANNNIGLTLRHDLDRYQELTKTMGEEKALIAMSLPLLQRYGALQDNNYENIANSILSEYSYKGKKLNVDIIQDAYWEVLKEERMKELEKEEL